MLIRMNMQGPSFFELAENYQVGFTALSYTINGPLLAYGFGVSTHPRFGP